MAVVGPVGAGKVGCLYYLLFTENQPDRTPIVYVWDLLQSSLLQLLIRELSPVSGSVIVDGKVSYASQEPWVFSGTLRENILFGLPYKAEWYQKVIEACSLDKVCVCFLHHHFS